jgi:hypothetical protein
MTDASSPLVLWRLRNPSDGQMRHCTVAECDGRFRLALSDTTAEPLEFDGRVAAIHHAARLATELRSKGWIDG